MATIKDIAQKTGYSISTVSYVLNKTKSVKPETQEKILQVARELEYRPNQTARSLKTRCTYTMGVIVPNIANPFFSDIIRGIEDVANEHKYSVILCNSDEKIAKEEKYINTLLSKNIDGLVFIGTSKTQKIADKLTGKPFVVVDRVLDEQTYSVAVDNVYGGYLATNCLLENRKEPVYFITGPLTAITYIDRMSGYLKAIQKHGIAYLEEHVVQCDGSAQGGYAVIQELYSNGKDIQSVFAANDMIAIGVMRALSEKKKKIPEDVALIGYDDIPTAAYIIPALTTIRQPRYEMGQKAAAMLIDQMNGKNIEGHSHILQPELIVRESI